jgi:hypothetical protein
MNKKKDYNHFPVRETAIIRGYIIENNKVSAKSEFRKDIVQLLNTNGYGVRFVPDRKIVSR